MQSLLVQLHLGSQDERLVIRIFFDGCMDDVVLTAGGRFLQPLDMEYCPIIGVLVQVIILMTTFVASSPPRSKSLLGVNIPS